MSLKSAIVRQFGKPSGFIGGLAGQIMARRSSNRIRNQRTVELMNMQPDSRVLEFGCGPGLALALCSEAASSGRVVGVDHSSVMISQARRRLARSVLGQRVELYTGGVECLTDWPKGFDRVYSLNVIQFIGDKASYYRHAFDALDTGGMCLTTYQPRLDNDDPNGAERVADEIEALMNSTGFQEITRTGISAGITPAICVSGIKLPAAS